MASFKKHTAKNGAITWRAQLFVNGLRDSKGGFHSKAEAMLWAAQHEIEILSKRSTVKPSASAKALLPTSVAITPKTLGDVFSRYSLEVSPTKAGAHWKSIRLYSFSKHKISHTPLTILGPEHIAQWRDDRLKQVSGSTVRREMTLIGHSLETARREWRWITVNPCRDVRKPPDAKHRTQRINATELQALLAALKYTQGDTPVSISHEVAITLLLALETAMRSGEVLSLRVLRRLTSARTRCRGPVSLAPVSVLGHTR